MTAVVAGGTVNLARTSLWTSAALPIGSDQMQTDVLPQPGPFVDREVRLDRSEEPRHELSSWIERRALDIDGSSVGVIVDIYLDVTTGRPTWLAIDVGWPHISTIAVTPAKGASELGENVILARDRHTILAALHRTVDSRGDHTDDTHLTYLRAPSPPQHS